MAKRNIYHQLLNCFVTGADSLRGTWGETLNANSILGQLIIKYHGGVNNASSNIPPTSGFQNTLIDIPLHSNGVISQLYFSNAQDMFFRPNQASEWRRIIDSTNIDSFIETYLKNRGGG